MKVPKIFTADQVHEAGIIVMEELAGKNDELAMLYGMTAICQVMIALGLRGPEDFYEPETTIEGGL